MTATEITRIHGDSDERSGGERTYTSAQVVALTGASWRQIDHLTRAYLRKQTGSGNARRYTADELDVVHAVVGLLAVGFTLAAAWAIAHELHERGEYSTGFGSIYELRVTVRDTTEEDR